jgi:hypothetical protein
MHANTVQRNQIPQTSTFSTQMGQRWMRIQDCFEALQIWDGTLNHFWLPAKHRLEGLDGSFLLRHCVDKKAAPPLNP